MSIAKILQMYPLWCLGKQAPFSARESNLLNLQILIIGCGVFYTSIILQSYLGAGTWFSARRWAEDNDARNVPFPRFRARTHTYLYGRQAYSRSDNIFWHTWLAFSTGLQKPSQDIIHRNSIEIHIIPDIAYRIAHLHFIFYHGRNWQCFGGQH